MHKGGAKTIKDWSAWLAGEDDQESVQAIRKATATGRACGSDDFIAELEVYLGHPLRPQKRGRKSRFGVNDDPGMAGDFGRHGRTGI
jgi:hypothetical protein